MFRPTSRLYHALASTHYPLPSPTLPPIILLHGLFGSRQNYRSLAASLSTTTAREVWTVDLVNHGDSPAVNWKGKEGGAYEGMADDVIEFIRDKGLGEVVLLGHSMSVSPLH